LCKNQKYLRSLIIVTSDKCYLNLEQSKSFKEDAPLGGNDPYSCSKAMAERLVKLYSDRVYKKTSIGLATVRAGNVIGGGDFSENRIIPDIFKHILKGKKLTLRNPKSYRPWQHVFDVLTGYLNLGIELSINKKKFSGSYNFGPKIKKNYTVLKLTQKFLDKLTNKKYKINFNKSNLFESHCLNINSNKARKKLKWKTKYTGSKMIEKTIDWYNLFIKNPKKIELFSKKQINDYFL
jgi:CDP-glucose 4,6-dehydratase